MKLTCKNCGVEFNSVYSAKKFCTKSCYSKFIKGTEPERLRLNHGVKPRKQKTSICSVCKNNFSHWVGRDAKFCSKVCWGKRNPPREYHCDECSKVFVAYEGNKRRARIYCSKPCADAGLSRNTKGDKCRFWEGGLTTKSQIIRRSREYRVWRTAVYERDNYTCVLCGAKCGDGKKIILNADHIKPFHSFPDLRFDVSNGRTLCVPCHIRTDTFGSKAKVRIARARIDAIQDTFLDGSVMEMKGSKICSYHSQHCVQRSIAK